jgi:hypothetical protein
MSPAVRSFALLAVAVVIAGSSRPARASEDAVPSSCEGTFSLLHPLPEACLGTIDTDRPHQTDIG